MKKTICIFVFVACALPAPFSSAQVPQFINYQGRVAVEGVNFDSVTSGHDGRFKFALVSGDGSQTYWSNDGTSVAGGEPTAFVSLPMSKGLYSVSLGDTAPPLGMAALNPAALAHPDVRLRVWFDDGAHGAQLLSPDQRLAAVAYAVMAGDVPDASISAEKIAPGAVGSTQLAAESVKAPQIAPGAVDNTKLVTSAITLNTGAGLSGGGLMALGGTLNLVIPDGGIGAAQLAPASVGSAQLAPAAVHAGNMASDAWLVKNAPGTRGPAVLTLDSGSADPARARISMFGDPDDALGPNVVGSRMRTQWSIGAATDTEWGYAGTTDRGNGTMAAFSMELGWEDAATRINGVPGTGKRQTEAHLTVNNRRIFTVAARDLDPWDAGMAIYLPLTVSVPAENTSDDPTFTFGGFKSDDSVIGRIQNYNATNVAASSGLRLQGLGSNVPPGQDWSVYWEVVADRNLQGVNDLRFFDGLSGRSPLVLKQDGTVEIGVETLPPALEGSVVLKIGNHAQIAFDGDSAATTRTNLGVAASGANTDISSLSAAGGVALGAGTPITRIRHGVATLTNGIATVPETSVTAASRIMLTSQSDGGVPGFLRVTARVPGVSFTIESSSGADGSAVAWVLIEP